MPEDLGLYLQKTSPLRNPVPILGTSGSIPWGKTNASRYTNDSNWKMLGFDLNRNNDYAYDDAQTTGQWWNSTLHRALNPLKTSFVEGFRYDKSARELFTSDSLAEDEGLKNYIKRSEELSMLYPNYDNPDVGEGFSSYFSAGARNKWSSLLESSGFMIGTAASGIAQSIALGLITGGGGTAVGVARTVANLSQAARISRLAQAYNQIGKLNNLWKLSKLSKLSPGLQAIAGVKDIAQAKNGLQLLKGAGKLVGNAGIRFQAASSEAMLEAIEGSEHFTAQQLEDFERDNGRPATKQEKDEIQDYAADLFSARYKANLGVLTVTNLVQDLSMFNTYRQLTNVGRVAERAAEKVVWSKKLGKFSYTGTLPFSEKSLLAAKNVGTSFLKNTFVEGIEEGAQYAIGTATNDYFTKKYNKDSVSFMDSVSRGVSSTFTDKEGRESFWSGIMMGGLFSTIGKGARLIHGKTSGSSAAIQRTAIESADKLNNAHATFINDFKIEHVLSSEVENGVLNHTNTILSEEARQRGDKKEVEKLRTQSLRNAIKTAKDTGKFELLIDRIKEYGEMTDEVFKTTFEVASTKPGKEIVQNTLSEIAEISKSIDLVNDKFYNPHQNYQNINPAKKPNEYAEAFIKYKAHEEAKMVVIENLENLKKANKQVKHSSDFFIKHGVVLEDSLAYLVPQQTTGINKDGVVVTKDSSKDARQTKIEELKSLLKETNSLLASSTKKAEKMLYQKQIQDTQKELDVFENLHETPESYGAISDYFKYYMEKNEKFLGFDDNFDFAESLYEHLHNTADSVGESTAALQALEALENPLTFAMLAESYAKGYEKRYGQVLEDLQEKATEDEQAAEGTPVETETEEEEIPIAGTDENPSSVVEEVATTSPVTEPEVIRQERKKRIPKSKLLTKIQDVEAEIERITDEAKSVIATKVELTNLLNTELVRFEDLVDNLNSEIAPGTHFYISNIEELRTQRNKQKYVVANLKMRLGEIEANISRIEAIKNDLQKQVNYYNTLRKEKGIYSKDFENIIVRKIEIIQSKIKTLTKLIEKVKKAVQRLFYDLIYISGQFDMWNSKDPYMIDENEVNKPLVNRIVNRLDQDELNAEEKLLRSGRELEALNRVNQNAKDLSRYLYELLEWSIEKNKEDELTKTLAEIEEPTSLTLKDTTQEDANKELAAEKKEQIAEIDEQIAAQKQKEEQERINELADLENQLDNPENGLLLQKEQAEGNESKLQVVQEKINAVYKRMGELGETKNIPDSEAKKADIERRRQEELENNNGSLTQDNIYSVKILLDPSAKVRGDKQTFVTREVMEAAYTNDKANNPSQPLDTIIKRGGYSLKELDSLLLTWRELLPSYKSINAKYDAELAALEEPITEPTIISDELLDLETQKKQIEDQQVETIVPFVPVHTIQNLNPQQITALQEGLLNAQNSFINGMVFRTAGEDMDDKNTLRTNRSVIGERRAEIRDAIRKRFEAGEITLNLTLQKDTQEFHPKSESEPESRYFTKHKNTDKHPIVAVLTDEKGNTLYFDDDGTTTTKELGYPIAQQVYEVENDSSQNAYNKSIEDRVKDRTEQRLKSLGLSKLFTGEEITPQEVAQIEADVRSEIANLAEIKRAIRANDLKITVENVNMSQGFLEDGETEIITAEKLEKSNGAKLSLRKTESFDSHAVPGLLYYDKMPMVMPKLSEVYNKVIAILLREKITPNVKPETMGKKELAASQEALKRRDFLNNILYTRTEEHNKAVTGVKFNNDEKINGNAQFVIKVGNTVLKGAEELFMRGLRVNVDNALLEANEPFIEYRIKPGKPLLGPNDEIISQDSVFDFKHDTYEDYLKSIGVVLVPKYKVTAKDRKLEPQRFNIVFGFNPSETITKYKNNNLPAQEAKKVESEPIMELGQESAATLQDAFSAFITEPEVQETPKEEKVEKKQYGVESPEKLKEDLAVLGATIGSVHFLPSTSAKKKVNIKIISFGESEGALWINAESEIDGEIKPRSYHAENFIELLIDERNKANPDSEQISSEGAADLNRAIIKENLFREGVTKDDLIKSLIKRNIVEKICNT